MIIFPAIDLKDGHCVRLKRGEMASATVFNDDPAAQALEFQNAGFSWLHCVDLNGAFDGRSVNAEAVKAIRAAITLPIQLGGGIRDLKGIEAWLEAGITRVILGTIALTNPTLVKEAARAFPGKIVVGADAKGGKIATEGWAETSEVTPIELGKRFEDAGVAAVLFTDVDRDGLLKGVNVGATAALAAALTIPVIASGGVGGIEDIKALVAEPNIEGVVVGRALYDGRIDPAEALKIAGKQ
ncbi:phosphoribosylformimino-5-aminoimidazole carboxamide ribotide isomerase [Rhizomicrobium palustre]|uniref:1-(5-phosphoribosyl)-5-[(5-phosphoribosylamino)methylideneamino] imidazole-4-carboxamide isomerase n=1 Tax=Rhizomicrobium palustre TaxID=189966 RepID=A0A846MZ31_9PROT|nr:phosphoribosylformimino-5-aminoimidazole carboxamide ribotide isomerase [Rhizomicrobium palustre]